MSDLIERMSFTAEIRAVDEELSPGYPKHQVYCVFSIDDFEIANFHFDLTYSTLSRLKSYLNSIGSEVLFCANILGGMFEIEHSKRDLYANFYQYFCDKKVSCSSCLNIPIKKFKPELMRICDEGSKLDLSYEPEE